MHHEADALSHFFGRVIISHLGNGTQNADEIKEEGTTWFRRNAKRHE